MEPSLHQVEALFHRALELPPAERANFLWQECAGNTGLFDAVHKLLAAEELDAKMVAPPAVPTPQEWRTGQSFGHYRIVRLLGKGGMGAVYLAERADGAFEQQVALKLLAPHLVEDTFAERFRAEQQMLAQLNHPHIVHLMDGGIGASGEPYLVTEYVPGEPLDRHAASRRLGVKDRIRIFLQVCSAVEYAHQNLVVHRDLKPSNILVTPEGNAKLLDFGTAKLVTSSEKTATESMLLTPRYASPEQLRNEPITTRSDVYSLGMILYELLSGARPFASTGDAIGELARAYQFTEPTALGKNITAEAAAERKASAADLSKELRGDLRAIASKALAHESAQRYATVGELADDLKAYLEGRAVKAQPASFGYLAGKFIQRQRYAVAAAALLLLAIAAGAVSTLREKARAERRFAQVRQLARFQLFDVFDEAERLPRSTRLRSQLAAEAVRYLDNLRQDVGNDEGLQLELAEGYLKAGNIYGNFTKDNLGEPEKARDAFEKGSELAAGLRGDAARWVQARLQLSLAMANFGSGKDGDARPEVESALRAIEGLMKSASQNPREYLWLGQAYTAMAKVSQSQGVMVRREDRSSEWADKAKAAFEKGLQYAPEDDELLGSLHSLCGNRSIWIGDTDPQKALAWAGEAEMWAIRRKASELVPSFLTAEATRLTGRASALSALGDLEAALPEMRKVADNLGKVAEDEDNFGAQLNHITGLLNLALIEYEMKRKQDYFASVNRAYQIAQKEMAKGRAASKTFQGLYFKVLYDLAYAVVELDKPEAPRLLRETYEVLRGAAEKDPANERVRFFLCDLLMNLDYEGYNRPEEAKRYAKEMIAAHPDNPNGYDFLAQAELRLKNVAGAIEAYKQAKLTLNKVDGGEAGRKFNTYYEEKIADLEKQR